MNDRNQKSKLRLVDKTLIEFWLILRRHTFWTATFWRFSVNVLKECFGIKLSNIYQSIWNLIDGEDRYEHLKWEIEIVIGWLGFQFGVVLFCFVFLGAIRRQIAVDFSVRWFCFCKIYICMSVGKSF